MESTNQNAKKEQQTTAVNNLVYMKRCHRIADCVAHIVEELCYTLKRIDIFLFIV